MCNVQPTNYYYPHHSSDLPWLLNSAFDFFLLFFIDWQNIYQWPEQVGIWIHSLSSHSARRYSVHALSDIHFMWSGTRNFFFMFVDMKQHSKNSLSLTGTNFPWTTILEMPVLVWKIWLIVHRSAIRWQDCITKRTRIIWCQSTGCSCRLQRRLIGKRNITLSSRFGTMAENTSKTCPNIQKGRKWRKMRAAGQGNSWP